MLEGEGSDFGEILQHTSKIVWGDQGRIHWRRTKGVPPALLAMNVRIPHPQMTYVLRKHWGSFQQICECWEATFLILSNGHSGKEVVAGRFFPGMANEGAGPKGWLIVVHEVENVINKFLCEILHALGCS